MNPDELRDAADRAAELLDAATPGPWEYNDVTHRVHDGPENEVVNDYVAFVPFEDDLPLIAATPDLLAVLGPAARQFADLLDAADYDLTHLASRLLDEGVYLQRTRAGFGETVGLLSEAAMIVQCIADAAAAARGEG